MSPKTARTIQRSTQIFFCLLLFFLLVSHATASNPGPFGWLSFPYTKLWPTQTWQIGILNLFLPLLGLGWIAIWRQQHPSRQWTFGPRHLTVPLLVLTIWTGLHFRHSDQLHLLIRLSLCWLIYLYSLNHSTHEDGIWPDFSHQITAVFSLVLLIQGVVAISQFVMQHQLGLVWLGEPTLDMTIEGTSVVGHAGQNWLRAYGLNSHPNQLGLVLVVGLLWIWPVMQTDSSRWRLFFIVTFTTGFAGLLVSFSRSGWLALLAGGIVFGQKWIKSTHHDNHEQKRPFPRYALITLLCAITLLFIWQFGDSLANRFWQLDSPLESRSLVERARDNHIAFQIIADHPIWGVGPDNYQVKAQQINPAANIVHNVPLLIAAELGLPGFGFWLYIMIFPLLFLARQDKQGNKTAIWIAMILISLVQPEPHLFLLKGSVLWGLALGSWAQSA